MLVEVWMENDIELSSLLAEEDGWEGVGSTWSFKAEDFTIEVGEPWAPEDEDVPADIREVMPGARLVMEWSLRDSDENEEEGEATLLQAAQDAASACGGVVYDPIESVVYVPAELDA